MCNRPRTHLDCLDGRGEEVLSPTTDNVVEWEGDDLVCVSWDEPDDITGDHGRINIQ